MMQAINFGTLQGVQVRDSEPILSGAAVAILDVKLDRDEIPRTELNLQDFVLSAEVVRLMVRLDQFRNGTIQSLEVGAGLPRRLVFESRVLETEDHLRDSNNTLCPRPSR